MLTERYNKPKFTVLSKRVSRTTKKKETELTKGLNKFILIMGKCDMLLSVTENKQTKKALKCTRVEHHD